MFEVVDCTESSGVSYLKCVRNRHAKTLLPIIQRVCLSGIILYSEQFASCFRLSEIGFEHFSVNHSDISYRFVSRDGIHTIHRGLLE